MNDKQTILLVDNDREFCMAIKKMFQKHGYMVSPVHDGIKALCLLEEEEFDLIISELGTPKLDGMELMEEINRRKIKAPVIFLTADGGVESYMDLMNMGAFDYLEKPVKESEIIRVVDSAVETAGESCIPLG